MLNAFKVIKHHFFGGDEDKTELYAKEMSIRDGYEVVTHKHKFKHVSALVSGCVIVEADGTQATYYSPDFIIIDAGVEHSITPVNSDAKWYCIHITDETDETKVDEVLIQKQPSMRKLPFTVPVDTLADELAANPQLWNQRNLRTFHPNSPHREVDDIWVRYREFSEFDPENPLAFADEHKSVWYDDYYQLPSLELIFEQVCEQLGEFELGGIFITRIPPGKQVYPHTDAGCWHSEYYCDKVLVTVKSAPKQAFCYETEQHESCAGDVFLFENQSQHWVINDSDSERISLIMAIKRSFPDE